MPWCSCYSRDSVGCRLRNGASDAVLSMAKKCAFWGLLYQMGKLLFLMLCSLRVRAVFKVQRSSCRTG